MVILLLVGGGGGGGGANVGGVVGGVLFYGVVTHLLLPPVLYALRLLELLLDDVQFTFLLLDVDHAAVEVYLRRECTPNIRGKDGSLITEALLACDTTFAA